VKKELAELIEIPLQKPELYKELGIDPPKAVLLYGATGVGKTYLIRKSAEKIKATLVSIDLSDISAEDLQKQFQQATLHKKPIVIYLVMHNPEQIGAQVVNMLCKILDGDTNLDLSSTIIAGSSVRPTLPDELRRSGRFDRELEVPLPNEEERLDIIQNLCKESRMDVNVDYKELVILSAGFTPADLIQALKTAARYAISSQLKSSDDNLKNLNNFENSSIFLGQNDLVSAFNDIKPTIFSEFGLFEPKVSWDSIGGHEDLKKTLWDNVIEPVIYKDYYKTVGVAGIKGIILYGPPGNGKSTLARAIATATKSRFLYINSTDFAGLSGDEKRLRQLFEIAKDAQPTLIFFDEAESLLPKRENAKDEAIKLVNEFLIQMDGIRENDNVIIIAASNFPENLDEAAIRTGRLELKLLVSPPNFEGRIAAFNNLTKAMNLDSDINYKNLAELTQPQDDYCYSFSDLKAIVRNSGTLSAREAIRNNIIPENVKISMNHFKITINSSNPSIKNIVLQKNSEKLK
jgi:transitional endoplasmic reticulum ATPase